MAEHLLTTAASSLAATLGPKADRPGSLHRGREHRSGKEKIAPLHSITSSALVKERHRVRQSGGI